MDTESDGDGVGDEVENAASNDGDGNGDGIADRVQNRVTSLRTYGGAHIVTFESPEGTTLSNFQVSPNPSTDDFPSGKALNYCMFDFTINGVGTGGSVALTLYLPEGARPISYIKYGPTPTDSTDHWYEFMNDGVTGAEISDNVITLNFVDAERGDDVLTQDGLVIDQGGPLFESPDPTRYGPGGGCFMGSLAPSSASPISFSCFSIAAFAALLLGSILASWRPINRIVLVFGMLSLCITGLRGYAMAADADADAAGSKHPVYFAAGLGFAHIDEAIHTRYSAANYQLTIANEIYPMLRLGYPLSDNYALELGARWDIYSGSIDRTNTTGSDNLRSYTLRGKKNLLGAVFGNGIASVAFLPPVDRSESRVKLFTVHHF